MKEVDGLGTEGTQETVEPVCDKIRVFGLLQFLAQSAPNLEFPEY